MIEAGGYPKTLEEMQSEVHEVNVKNGWFDSERTFGDGIALMHSEISEALEAFRNWGLTDHTSYYVGHAAEFPENNLPLKPEGVGSEFADIFIRLLDECERYGINLREEYERKIKYNRTRGFRHGGKAL